MRFTHACLTCHQRLSAVPTQYLCTQSEGSRCRRSCPTAQKPGKPLSPLPRYIAGLLIKRALRVKGSLVRLLSSRSTGARVPRWSYRGPCQPCLVGAASHVQCSGSPCPTGDLPTAPDVAEHATATGRWPRLLRTPYLPPQILVRGFLLGDPHTAGANTPTSASPCPCSALGLAPAADLFNRVLPVWFPSRPRPPCFSSQPCRQPIFLRAPSTFSSITT